MPLIQTDQPTAMLLSFTASIAQIKHIRAFPCRSQTCACAAERRSEREAEIAAKIADLRRRRRVQKRDGGTKDANEDESCFADQIAEAEAFLGSAPDSSSEYKPKVSTWGVFPRPSNISRSYGGGRNIEIGGKKPSEESLAHDKAIREKLAAYRRNVGIDTELEEANAQAIEDALTTAEQQMKTGRPYDVVRTLRSIVPFVSFRSRRGGQVYLALAVAYEETGQQEESRRIYSSLRRNSFPEIAKKAKQLSAGFSAMEKLKVENDTSENASRFRVTDFSIPDVAKYSEKRYETTLPFTYAQKGRTEGDKQRAARKETQLREGQAVLAGLVVLLLASILFVLYSRGLGQEI